jgi:hypothetical protein
MTRTTQRLASVILASVAPLGALAGDAPAPMTPKDAGQRYGQALGVIEVCHGSKLTEKANSLSQSYTGTELEAFKAAAAGVFEAWNGVKNCVHAADPNQCKIIMDKSCLLAEDEIGPSGKALPGLVMFAVR